MPNTLEQLLLVHKGAAERYVYCRMPQRADAEDVLQEVYLAAWRGFSGLTEKSAFKPWLLRIAKNACADFYRRQSRNEEVVTQSPPEPPARWGREEPAQAVLLLLRPIYREVLWLYYFQGFTQKEIAARLSLPLGTVKSRLFAAKKEFRKEYRALTPEKTKGEKRIMKKLPEYLPEYSIRFLEKEPFSVKWEELMGWFLVPREGEACQWGIYNHPKKRLGEWNRLQVTGKAEVHGIQGVEISAETHSPMPANRAAGQKDVQRRFIAQLTETHCRYLAESHMENGVRKLHTFLDDGAFLENWGFGKDNCGKEIHTAPKGNIVRREGKVTAAAKKDLLDVVGRCEVTVGGVSYDAVCIIDISCYNAGVASQQFVDAKGRTVLWRRFNRNDWHFKRYKKTWAELLPQNERMEINGETYVHWYDCITDYIL